MAVKKNVNPLDLVKDIVKIASETKAIEPIEREVPTLNEVLKLPLPATVNFWPGVETPMPTLPDG